MTDDRINARARRSALLLAIALLSACGGGGGGRSSTPASTPSPPPSTPPPTTIPPPGSPPPQVTATFTVTLSGIHVERPSNGETQFVTISNVWNERLELAE